MTIPDAPGRKTYVEADFTDPSAGPCDLILEGGVASGVVHPNVVFELARKHRLNAIGATSAGAAPTSAGATTATRGAAPPTKARKSGKATGKPTGGSTAAGIRALALTRTRKNVRDQLSHFHRVRVL